MKKNNKGFSLVELIVVMAIMAILVGAVAPQVVKYVEKSREAKDLQVVNIVYNAFYTSIISSEESMVILDEKNIEEALLLLPAKIKANVNELIDDMNTIDEIQKKCKSKKGTEGTLFVKYSSGVLSVYIGSTKDITKATIGPITNQ